METALDDFMHHCRIERRLAPLTCSAYERDVAACLRFLQADGIGSWSEVRPHLRRFLADEATHRPTRRCCQPNATTGTGTSSLCPKPPVPITSWPLALPPQQ